LQSGGREVGGNKNGKAKDKKNTLYRVFLGVKGRKLSTPHPVLLLKEKAIEQW